MKETVEAGKKEYIRQYKEFYRYNERYKEDFIKIKNKYSDKNFIIFISPVSKQLINIIWQYRFEEYKRWLRELVSVFGNIYNFAYHNDITNNLNNYQDLRHYYPYVGKIIINSILDNTQKSYVILNKNNIEEWFEIIEKNKK